MTLTVANSADAELLRRYAKSRSEESFAELVGRHLDVVHSAALRQVRGNPAAAADVAQGVFTELARQAPRLARHPALVGWLYTTTHRLAARHVRDETRRLRREQEAHAMQELHRPMDSEADWARLAPVLDDVMHELGEADRLALLLRHFEQRSFAEIGARLGLNENAARMRVERALEKLRARLAQRGITSTASALALSLGGLAVAAAPTTLAATVTAAALAATITTSTFGLISLMASTKLKTAGAALLIAAAGTTIAVQQLSARRLRAENSELRQRADQSAEAAQAARLSASQSADALARSSSPSAELLRLRGEVGFLRQQLAAVSAAAPPVASPPDVGQSVQEDEEAERDASREFAIRRMNAAKSLVVGLILFASEHGDRFPESLEAVADQLKPDPSSPDQADTVKSLKAEDFELMFRGSLKDIGNPAEAIVLREREALPLGARYGGGWGRTYGFVDGHSEIHGSDNGDFSTWEAEHQPHLATGSLPGAGTK